MTGQQRFRDLFRIGRNTFFRTLPVGALVGNIVIWASPALKPNTKTEIITAVLVLTWVIFEVVHNGLVQSSPDN